MKHVHTITKDDVGKIAIQIPGSTLWLGDAIGHVQEIDIGKRVYNNRETIQVESTEQLNARKSREHGFSRI